MADDNINSANFRSKKEGSVPDRRGRIGSLRGYRHVTPLGSSTYACCFYMRPLDSHKWISKSWDRKGGYRNLIWCQPGINQKGLPLQKMIKNNTPIGGIRNNDHWDDQYKFRRESIQKGKKASRLWSGSNKTNARQRGHFILSIQTVYSSLNSIWKSCSKLQIFSFEWFFSYALLFLICTDNLINFILAIRKSPHHLLPIEFMLY